MKRINIVFTFFLLLYNLPVASQVADFTIPDTVCVNKDILVKNTSVGASTYYWNFCSGNLAADPAGVNLGNSGALNGPVYSALAKDGTNFYAFITNVNDGTLTRLSFGNSLTNQPAGINLGSLGVLMKNIEGIQIEKDSTTGNWFGLIAGGENRFLIRLDFGNSLNNIPSAANLGNINNLMGYSHSIYTFTENGNWHTLMLNADLNNIVRFDFGNSLVNPPTAVNLGNLGGLNEPVGFYPVQENGLWSLFVVNKSSNALSRLDFGSSLTNTPTGKYLGNISGKLNAPRSITILRDCGKVFGFIVNEIPNDIVRLTFPNGLLSKPNAESLGNIAGFDFPHHISELFRVGDSLYTFVMNVDNSSISRLCFASCNSSSVASSTLKDPPAFSYSSPGIYNISLVINEGMPTQSNTCREIICLGAATPTIAGDSAICSGSIIDLEAVNDTGYLYQWIGPNSFSSTSQHIILPDADTTMSGTYSLIADLKGCLSDTVSREISISTTPEVDLGNDTVICQGVQLFLDAGKSIGNYQWSTGETTSVVSVVMPGIYSLLITNNNCTASDTINIENCGSALFCPSAFSPNSDGLNDRYSTKCQGILYTYRISIFNRWGQLVYDSDNPLEGWDGTFAGSVCPVGVYTYAISYSVGTLVNSSKPIVKRGTFSLIR